MSGDVEGRAALGLGAGVVGAAATGLVAALLADRVGADGSGMGELSRIINVSAVVVVVAHVVVLAATLLLTRSARLKTSLLAQPAQVFAALRVVGAVVVACGFFWPSLRQPLAGTALAVIDAAFVASVLLMLAPLFGGQSMRVVVVAVVYAAYRLAFALATFLPEEARTSAAFAHRLVSVVVVACVFGACVGAAARLRAPA